MRQGLGRMANKLTTPPGGQTGGPYEKAAGSATRRVVRLTISVRPAAPEQNRTEDHVARQPWAPPAKGAACDHGAGVCVIRSALSDQDGNRLTGQVAETC